MKESKYNLVYDINENEKIIYNTRTLGLAVLTENEYDILKKSGKTNSDKKIVEDLYESGFLVDDDANEILVLRNRLNSERYSKEVLRMTIAPTLNCNFSCEYCYEQCGEKKVNVIMNDNTQEKLFEFMCERSTAAKKIEVVWYGGEPLLAMGVIERLSKKIIKLCENKKIEYTSSMITNGYLLNKEIIQQIKECKIQTLQITLDGPQEIHDSRRILKNGQQTFEKILSNIEALDNSIEIVIRTNVDKTNQEYVYRLIEQIASIGKTNLMFNIANVKSEKNKENLLSMDEFARVWLSSNDMCEKCNVKHGSYCMPKGANYCDADSDNSFVIDSEGYIYKCWQDIGNKKSSIGSLNERLKFSSLYYDYMTFDATEDKVCKECTLLPLCMGGCPYERVHNEDKCPMYKKIIKDIVFRLANYEEN